MGKTISVTIPTPLVEKLQKAANTVGISRSRFISNLLLKWDETETINNPINDCVNRRKNGICKTFDLNCQAPQQEAMSCAGYDPKVGE